MVQEQPICSLLAGPNPGPRASTAPRRFGGAGLSGPYDSQQGGLTRGPGCMTELPCLLSSAQAKTLMYQRYQGSLRSCSVSFGTGGAVLSCWVSGIAHWKGVRLMVGQRWFHGLSVCPASCHPCCLQIPGVTRFTRGQGPGLLEPLVYYQRAAGYFWKHLPVSWHRKWETPHRRRSSCGNWPPGPPASQRKAVNTPQIGGQRQVGLLMEARTFNSWSEASTAPATGSSMLRCSIEEGGRKDSEAVSVTRSGSGHSPRAEVT